MKDKTVDFVTTEDECTLTSQGYSDDNYSVYCGMNESENDYDTSKKTIITLPGGDTVILMAEYRPSGFWNHYLELPPGTRVEVYEDVLE